MNEPHNLVDFEATDQWYLQTKSLTQSHREKQNSVSQKLCVSA